MKLSLLTGSLFVPRERRESARWRLGNCRPYLASLLLDSRITQIGNLCTICSAYFLLVAIKSSIAFLFARHISICLFLRRRPRGSHNATLLDAGAYCRTFLLEGELASRIRRTKSRDLATATAPASVSYTSKPFGAAHRPRPDPAVPLLVPVCSVRLSTRLTGLFRNAIIGLLAADAQAPMLRGHGFILAAVPLANSAIFWPMKFGFDAEASAAQYRLNVSIIARERTVLRHGSFLQ
jgi:hypothetical protein